MTNKRNVENRYPDEIIKKNTNMEFRIAFPTGPGQFGLLLEPKRAKRNSPPNANSEQILAAQPNTLLIFHTIVLH